MLKLLPKYNPCQLNGWLWIALLVGMVLVFYACATMPEMCIDRRGNLHRGEGSGGLSGKD
jgi:hypothetical protein